MTLRLQRFDFGSLHDFRGPIKLNLAAVAEATEAAVPPPPPVYNEQDIENTKAAAKKLGYAEGFEAGLQQAATEAASREKDMANAITRINQQMELLTRNYQGLVTEQSAELVELVTMISRKVADVALDAKGADMIAATVARCLPVIFSKPKITIELHPEMLEITSPTINAQLTQQGYAGDVQFKANPEFGRHDVKVDWGNGQAARTMESLWLEIEALLQQVSLIPTLPEQPVNEPTEPAKE